MRTPPVPAGRRLPPSTAGRRPRADPTGRSPGCARAGSRRTRRSARGSSGSAARRRPRCGSRGRAAAARTRAFPPAGRAPPRSGPTKNVSSPPRTKKRSLWVRWMCGEAPSRCGPKRVHVTTSSSLSQRISTRRSGTSPTTSPSPGTRSSGWPTSSSTAIQPIRSSTARHIPRSWRCGRRSSATRRSRSPITTASTARSSSPTRRSSSASARSPAPSSPCTAART